MRGNIFLERDAGVSPLLLFHGIIPFPYDTYQCVLLPSRRNTNLHPRYKWSLTPPFPVSRSWTSELRLYQPIPPPRCPLQTVPTTPPLFSLVLLLSPHPHPEKVLSMRSIFPTSSSTCHKEVAQPCFPLDLISLFLSMAPTFFKLWIFVKRAKTSRPLPPGPSYTVSLSAAPHVSQHRLTSPRALSLFFYGLSCWWSRM